MSLYVGKSEPGVEEKGCPSAFTTGRGNGSGIIAPLYLPGSGGNPGAGFFEGILRLLRLQLLLTYLLGKI